MNLPGTDIVAAEDERPARRDGTCFYCSRPIGAPHKAGCVIVSKSVVVRVTLEVVVSKPRDWTAQSINFCYNEGSWCSDNMLEGLGQWAAGNDDRCACSVMDVEVVRDATAEDHATLPNLLGERESTGA